MKNIIGKFLAVLLIAGVGVTVAGSPAFAARWDNCPTGKFCLYQGQAGSGSMYYWTPPSVGSCTNVGNPFNDTGTSFKNNTGIYVGIWENACGTSTNREWNVISPGGYVIDLGTEFWHPGADNSVSAITWGG
jgi:hypothetical protein